MWQDQAWCKINILLGLHEFIIHSFVILNHSYRGSHSPICDIKSFIPSFRRKTIGFSDFKFDKCYHRPNRTDPKIIWRRKENSPELTLLHGAPSPQKKDSHFRWESPYSFLHSFIWTQNDRLLGFQPANPETKTQSKSVNENMITKYTADYPTILVHCYVLILISILVFRLLH